MTCILSHFLTMNIGRKKRRLDALPAPGETQTLCNPLPYKIGAPRSVYNLGQSCYLSVILQAMAHNPLMRDYFLRNQHNPKSCANEQCIACALTESLKELLTTEEKEPHAPVELLFRSWQNNSVSRLSLRPAEKPFSSHNQTLAGYAQQDAHEYFQFIVNQLHESSGFHNLSRTKQCACISHTTFSGQLRSTVTCLYCGTVTISSDPIIDLSLDIRAASAQSDLSSSQGSIDSAETAAALSGSAIELKLTTCLQNFAAPENLPAEEGYICRSRECNRTPQTVTKHLTIKKLPATLCIHIKRYEHGRHTGSSHKLPTRLTFPLQLDMSPYTTRTQDRSPKEYEIEDFFGSNFSSMGSVDPRLVSSNTGRPISPRSLLSAHSPGWYDLSTIVVHKGTMQAGHYLNYCKRDGKWLRYDDAKVDVVGDATVLAQNPYMLLYQSRDGDSFDEE